jgi:hypothetical protein
MKTAQILREKIDSGELTVGMIATFHVWSGIGEPLMLLQQAMSDIVNNVRNNAAVAGDTKTPLP